MRNKEVICIVELYSNVKITHMTWKHECRHVKKQGVTFSDTPRRCQGYTKKMENTLVWGNNACSKSPIHPAITALGLSEFSPSLPPVGITSFSWASLYSPSKPPLYSSSQPTIPTQPAPHTHPPSQPSLCWRRQAVLGLSRLANHYCAAEEFVMQGTQAIHSCPPSLTVSLPQCITIRVAPQNQDGLISCANISDRPKHSVAALI